MHRKLIWVVKSLLVFRAAVMPIVQKRVKGPMSLHFLIGVSFVTCLFWLPLFFVLEICMWCVCESFLYISWGSCCASILCRDMHVYCWCKFLDVFILATSFLCARDMNVVCVRESPFSKFSKVNVVSVFCTELRRGYDSPMDLLLFLGLVCSGLCPLIWD